ncbi:MAG: squalene/phytoene synthase family protein [Planctomycetes bacterium]|nr:squalene/phytoene synthase family protein [Planctomycetota bacterium]
MDIDGAQCERGQQQQEEGLAESDSFCRRVVRARARNFYYGMKLTPEPERSALYALYAWTRYADDVVDDAGDAAAAGSAIDGMLTMTEGMLLHGEAAVERGTFWPAFAHYGRLYSFDMADLESMLAGQLDDLVTSRRRTFDDLYRYCDRVAGTVGRLCLGIWGQRDGEDSEAARQLAEWRGIAFQLTNILRDVREDCERGRLYLPLEDLEHFDLNDRQLLEWSKPAECRAFVLFQIERARTYYERSRGFECVVSERGAPASWAMAAVYRRLLEQMAANPEVVVGRGRGSRGGAANGVAGRVHRAQVSRARKVMIMAVAPWAAGRAKRAGR